MRTVLQGYGQSGKLVPRCFQRASEPTLHLGAFFLARPRFVLGEKCRDHRIAHQTNFLQARFQRAMPGLLNGARGIVRCCLDFRATLDRFIDPILHQLPEQWQTWLRRIPMRCGHLCLREKEHAMSQKLESAIAVIGIDIGKNSFHVVGHNERGAIVLRQKWSRGQVEARFANMPPCLVGMEACVGAHHLSRKLNNLGHNARLMPAKYVRPYSKGQKNDFRDAEAIAEAVQRPTMKFVATKTAGAINT
jgi:hypothetical protein